MSDVDKDIQRSNIGKRREELVGWTNIKKKTPIGTNYPPMRARGVKDKFVKDDKQIEYNTPKRIKKVNAKERYFAIVLIFILIFVCLYCGITESEKSQIVNSILPHHYDNLKIAEVSPVPTPVPTPDPYLWHGPLTIPTTSPIVPPPAFVVPSPTITVEPTSNVIDEHHYIVNMTVYEVK
jgi:hypothetical protein